MSAPIRPAETPYTLELRAYHLRMAAWLGLDPEKIMHLADVDRVQCDSSSIAMPPGVDVTWESIDERVAATQHHRHPVPVIACMADGVTTFRDGLHLDWQETEQLRAEIGERPRFPAPAGGWPAHWPSL